MSNEIEQQQSDTEKQSAGSDRKQQILLQAVEIIASEGYAKLSMRSLARASGITLGALQYHFSTWADMLRALNSYILDQYDKVWETISCKVQKLNKKRLHRTNTQSVLSSPEVKKILNVYQKHYVFVPTDKGERQYCYCVQNVLHRTIHEGAGHFSEFSWREI